MAESLLYQLVPAIQSSPPIVESVDCVVVSRSVEPCVPVITSTKDEKVTTLTAGKDYTWTTKGLITFTTAPASGAVLKWSGAWYYRCHFKEDTAEFQTIFNGGGSLDELVLETVKLP